MVRLERAERRVDKRRRALREAEVELRDRQDRRAAGAVTPVPLGLPDESETQKRGGAELSPDIPPDELSEN